MQQSTVQLIHLPSPIPLFPPSSRRLRIESARLLPTPDSLCAGAAAAETFESAKTRISGSSIYGDLRTRSQPEVHT
ncbi:hypothetical protein LshimejAT787_1200200 [Lyophyllum shimeji]|uniref:Uncharacterized protein n=1 Tax=Lyophyllum shimeji TaxID=47721 RepID=A0A9P3PWN4_LYOSH|nr:hypothetical protein LshimejAT787_1200200 [Lyophyllum shimeji]